MRRFLFLIAGCLFWIVAMAAPDVIYIANKGAVQEKCTMSASFFRSDSDQDMIQFYRPEEGKAPSSIGIYSNTTGKLKGFVPASEQNYQYLGAINENQVSIHKTYFDVLPELIDTSAMLDPEHLTRLALQRSTSARDALDKITSLAEIYGYAGGGVSFVLSDNNETWLLQMVGKGAQDKGAVWVGFRYPANTIAAVGQGCFIQNIVFDSPSFVFSSDLISFAREKGWYQGVNSAFDFYETYVREDIQKSHQVQACVWEYYKNFDLSLVGAFDPSNDSILQRMPLYITPTRMVERSSFRAMVRSAHKQLSVQGVAAGSVSLVLTEMRDRMSPSMGGLLWFTPGSADVSPFVPLYVGITDIPYWLLPSVCADKEVPSLFTVTQQVGRLKEKYDNLLVAEIEEALGQSDLSSLEASRAKEREWGDLPFADQEALEKGLSAYCSGAAEEILDQWLRKAFFWMDQLSEDPASFSDQNIEVSSEIIGQ